MLTLKKQIQLFKKNNFRPRKKLGQNFLVSSYMVNRIVKSVNLTSSDIVLEIGAGSGNLTENLVARCNKVIAIEKDKKLANIIKNRLSCDNLEIVCGDILKLNVKDIVKGNRVKVIGNLPYYISSDIIQYILNNRTYFSSFYCSLQKEFAERIIEKPGSKKYGRLTIFVKYYTDAKILFDIPSKYFYPRPSVDSCFMKFHMRSKPFIKVQDENFFFKLVKVGFSKRRKKIINCLTPWLKNQISKGDLIKIFDKLKIDRNIRAEKLSINKFGMLSDLVYREKCDSKK